MAIYIFRNDKYLYESINTEHMEFIGYGKSASNPLYMASISKRYFSIGEEEQPMVKEVTREYVYNTICSNNSNVHQINCIISAFFSDLPLVTEVL